MGSPLWVFSKLGVLCADGEGQDGYLCDLRSCGHTCISSSFALYCRILHAHETIEGKHVDMS